MQKQIVVEDKTLNKHTKNLTPISAQVLKERFGSSSPIYPGIIEVFESLWKEVRDKPGTKIMINSWVTTIGTLYGYKPDISLFLDHTYLDILAKIAVYLKLEKSPNREDILDVINR